MEVQKNSRYERKFVNIFGLGNAKYSILINPGLFKEIHSERRVNNIYFDTLDLKYYRQHKEGGQNRFKVRIRWYGSPEGQPIEPMLEIKIKKGTIGSKIRLKLLPFQPIDLYTKPNLLSLLAEDTEDFYLTLLENLKPTLINNYLRKYYTDSTQKFRATFDHSIVFSKPLLQNYKLKLVTNHGLEIIELKYDVDNDPLAEKICNHLPFRMTKISKYIRGLEKLNGGVFEWD